MKTPLVKQEVTCALWWSSRNTGDKSLIFYYYYFYFILFFLAKMYSLINSPAKCNEYKQAD